MAVFFMNKQESTLLLLDENAQLVVICHDCPRVLYEAELHDRVTRTVSESSARTHRNAFSRPHRISIILGNEEIYCTR